MRQQEGGHDGADDGAILRGLIGEEVGGPQMARARHVLDHDGRAARDMVRPMARHEAGVGVLSAAGARGDDELNGLAREEGLLLLRQGGDGPNLQADGGG